MSDSAPLMIMAGGTGGHIFPALAVAERVRSREIPVVWLGSRGGMETRLVPKYGIEMVALSVKGVRGKGLVTLLLAPFKLAFAVSQAAQAILKYQPQAVLGLGGFASGPGGIAAWLLHKPVFVHEQNAIPGMTNRWLARIARCAMAGFPSSFRMVATSCPAVYTGNPVRREIVELPPAAQRMVGRSGAIRLLVIGGSLGALRLNQVIPAALGNLAGCEVEIWHQCGARHVEVTQQSYAEAGVVARIEPFIENMAEAYGWADLVIARAGALTVAELIQVGIAALLVPYPHAVDDHQTVNARTLVDIGAARLMADSELAQETLSPVFAELFSDRTKLLRMAESSNALKTPLSAEHVARICLGEMRCDEPLPTEIAS